MHYSSLRALSLVKILALKGVFAKNEGGYRLNAIKKRFWSLLILLLSVASIRRKLLKITYTQEQIQKIATFNTDHKIINLIPNNHSDKSKICSDQKRLFFAVSIYPLWFFTNTPFEGKPASPCLCLVTCICTFSLTPSCFQAQGIYNNSV